MIRATTPQEVAASRETREPQRQSQSPAAVQRLITHLSLVSKTSLEDAAPWQDDIYNDNGQIDFDKLLAD